MREKDMYRDKSHGCVIHSVCLSGNKVMVITAIPLVTCVTSETEKEYYGEKYSWVKQEACCLATVNHTALEDCICCKPVFTLRKQVFWVVALCG
jgi:hypothetical protein